VISRGPGPLPRRVRATALCAIASLSSLGPVGSVVSAAPVAADPRPAPGHAERVEYRDPTTAPARGPSNALVTIEVFFVPTPNMPGTMIALLQQLQELQERHPTRVRLVYRILKSGSQLLVANAALEAHAEGKFFELMAELGKQRTVLKREDLLELARKVGVDPQRLGLAIQLDQYRDLLDANQRRFERLHAGNTPSVLFNATVVRIAPTVAAPDLEHEYDAAYGRALQKLDRGFPVSQLAAAFDDEAMASVQPNMLSGGSRDDDSDRSPLDHPLASPPLRLAGLPSFGKPGIAAAAPIVVLCRPNDNACSSLLRVVEPAMRLYPDDVRIVWAPWFDVSRDDAAELTLLGDAALCAEAIGSNRGELTTSPGWVWVRQTYTEAGKTRTRTADQLIDKVARELHVDGRALAACRARMATTTLSWIEAARHAGVPRNAAAAVVIGGRIYDGLTDPTLIQELIEAELAPGVLGSLPRWHTGK
jgi:protein-disulfide isomerase